MSVVISTSQIIMDDIDELISVIVPREHLCLYRCNVKFFGPNDTFVIIPVNWLLYIDGFISTTINETITSSNDIITSVSIFEEKVFMILKHIHKPKHNRLMKSGIFESNLDKIIYDTIIEKLI